MPTKIVNRNRNRLKLFVIAAACLVFAGIALSRDPAKANVAAGSDFTNVEKLAEPDDAKAKAAFSEAVKVFFSARCANCHPGGNAPTMGDAMTPHSQNVVRGKEGWGEYGMSCTTCHQDENLAGQHMPPGTAKPWHMPPADQKMVFQGISAGQLCRNFKDPAKNGGHKTLRDAMDHIQNKDPLVMWGWEPGNGRTLPPMSFEDFSARIETWVSNGGACPD